MRRRPVVAAIGLCLLLALAGCSPAPDAGFAFTPYPSPAADPIPEINAARLAHLDILSSGLPATADEAVAYHRRHRQLSVTLRALEEPALAAGQTELALDVVARSQDLWRKAQILGSLAAPDGGLAIAALSPGALAAPWASVPDPVPAAGVEMRAAVRAPDGLESVVMTVDGREVGTRLWTNGEGGTYIVSHRVTWLGPGIHRATVHVEDTAGRAGILDWTFETTAVEAPTVDGELLSLYFPDRPLVGLGVPGPAGLVRGVTRIVPSTATPARTALEQLIAGPARVDGEVFAPLTPDTEVGMMLLERGVLYVELKTPDELPGGSLAGVLAVQSIVLTLTSFPTVHSVQAFSADGEPWSDGHFAWNRPLTAAGALALTSGGE